MVPWGFYYFNDENDVTRVMATDALASCIAFIYSYGNGKTVLFAHVSSDGEAKDIAGAIRRLDQERSELRTYIAVLGATPQSETTLKRLGWLVGAASQGFHVYQSTQGAVGYNSKTSMLHFGSKTITPCTVPRSAMIAAMMKAPTAPLTPIEGSLDISGYDV